MLLSKGDHDLPCVSILGRFHCFCHSSYFEPLCPWTSNKVTKGDLNHVPYLKTLKIFSDFFCFKWIFKTITQFLFVTATPATTSTAGFGGFGGFGSTQPTSSATSGFTFGQTGAAGSTASTGLGGFTFGKPTTTTSAPTIGGFGKGFDSQAAQLTKICFYSGYLMVKIVI